MNAALIEAITHAESLEHIADAIEAGIEAAYVNNPRHGTEVAIAALSTGSAASASPPEQEPEPIPEPIPEPPAPAAPPAPPAAPESSGP